MYFVVYRLACKGHSRFRLGLLCNPRTMNHPQSLCSLCSPLKPSFTLYLLALALQNTSLLSDLTPVRVSFAIKSLATLIIRVDSQNTTYAKSAHNTPACSVPTCIHHQHACIHACLPFDWVSIPLDMSSLSLTISLSLLFPLSLYFFTVSLYLTHLFHFPFSLPCAYPPHVPHMPCPMHSHPCLPSYLFQFPFILSLPCVIA